MANWEPKLGDLSISPEALGAGASIVTAVVIGLARYLKDRLSRTVDPMRGVATLIASQQRQIDKLTRENEQLHDQIHALTYRLARAGIDPVQEGTNARLGESELRRPDRSPGDGKPTGD